jgi:hypothetical protein
MTREEAREILTHNWTRVDNPNYSESELDEAFFMAIEALTTERTGEWIDCQEYGYVECPFCGHATNCEDNKDELHFCFYCGAKMKGGAE